MLSKDVDGEGQGSPETHRQQRNQVQASGHGDYHQREENDQQLKPDASEYHCVMFLVAFARRI
ncbi:hypothetical protein BC830DRAFT_1104646 [Chytriomyces sp. MP71]|nr:hypothetical protein BC830DRAFT_1104646 [Chytriomyces sp. MP71]